MLSVCELINAIARKSMRSRNLLVVVAGCCLRAPGPATLCDWGLQPYVMGPATLCDGVCNPM